VYHNGQWWGNGWAPHVADENTSVHSALSGDSYPFGYPPAHYDPNFYNGMYQMPYHPPEHPPEHSPAGSYPGAYYPPGFDPYNNPEHALAANSGWYGHYDPSMMYGVPPGEVAPATPGGSPPRHDAPVEQQTPHQGDSSQIPMSPFWGHMDYQMHTTLAHAGIVTPHKAPPPSTPHRKDGEEKKDVEEIDAQPLLINNNVHYQPYSQMYGEAYVPPSPATQFMMSPQANAQAAAYYAAYNQFQQPYYVSPHKSSATRRRCPKRTSPKRTPAKNETLVIRKVDETSDSEVTVATAAESESVA
jgi:hypothetical protein